jgi:hypothetical protein
VRELLTLMTVTSRCLPSLGTDAGGEVLFRGPERVDRGHEGGAYARFGRDARGAENDLLLHTDDATRLGLWKTAGASPAPTPSYLRQLTMLELQLNHRGVLRDPKDGAGWLFDRTAIRRAMLEHCPRDCNTRTRRRRSPSRPGLP